MAAGNLFFRIAGNVHFLVSRCILQLRIMGKLRRCLVATDEFTLPCICQGLRGLVV